MRILEKEPKNLEDALNMASLLEAFDMMGSTGPEAEKSKSRYVRAAAGGKEYTVSGEAKMSDEILKQQADLNGLFCSYRRDLDKQQQEIETLKRSHQSPYLGNWNLPPEPRPTACPEERRSSLEPVQAPRRPVRNGGGHQVRSGPQLGDTCRNCGGKDNWARECRTAQEYGNTPAERRTAGGSVSIVTYGRNGVEVYLAFGLKGRGVYGLLNTGCDTSVVSRKVIPNELLKPTTQKLYGANGTEIALLGEVELTLKLDDLK